MNSWSPGKIAATVVGGFFYLILLLAALVINIYFLSYYLYVYIEEDSMYTEEYEDYMEDFEWEEGLESENNADYEEDFDLSQEDGEYYEFGNALRDDLSYQVTFEEFYRDDFTEEGEGKAVVEFSYPVVEGDVANLDAINTTIQSELREVEDFTAAVIPHLTAEDAYYYTAETYVTYMSEDILSVIFVEYGYLNDEFVESYVKCFNVDMQTGMILKNTQILDIDDAFSIDFRERCEKQNGEIDALSYYMDQDITDLLTDESSLIIFYTPLGMEVGFNYQDGWATVTYQDYEQYEKKF